MNCPGCGAVLARHELAQPMTVVGVVRRPATFCTACCKAAPTHPSSADALERLIRGDIDPVEANRVRDALGLPPAPPVEPIGTVIDRARRHQ